MKLFSSKSRPMHLGPFPLERLRRLHAPHDQLPDTPIPVLRFERPETPQSICNAMAPFQAMMDVLRDGPINTAGAVIPDSPVERANHLKSFGYYNDA